MGRDSSLVKGARRWGGGPPCADPSCVRINRRTKTVRKKKPGRSARNDGIFVLTLFFPALTHFVALRVRPQGLTYGCDAPLALGR